MKIKILTALLVMSLPASAFAMVDENDEPNETTLQTTQQGFDIRIQNINDPGNSARVEVRPRNSNCVGGGANPVTSNYVATGDPDAINNAISTSLAQPVLHDNPACFTDRWGWFSVDTNAEGMSEFVIHGTLKSYIIQVTIGKDKDEKQVITRLRTDSK